MALPLRLGGMSERSAQWECGRCGSSFMSVYDTVSPKHRMSLIRLGDLHFDASRAPKVTPQIKARIEMIVESQRNEEFHEARREKRIRRSLPITGVRVDENLSPTGGGFSAMLVDISTGGLGMVSLEPIDTESVIVQLPKPQDRLMQVVLKITHNHEIDRDLYRVGGPLVGRFAEAVVQA